LFYYGPVFYISSWSKIQFNHLNPPLNILVAVTHKTCLQPTFRSKNT